MGISDHNYNIARGILIQAGSHTANAAHSVHTKGAGVNDKFGMKLLREAEDEFCANDAGLPNLQSGMTLEHYKAIRKAAKQMKIANW